MSYASQLQDLVEREVKAKLEQERAHRSVYKQMSMVITKNWTELVNREKLEKQKTLSAVTSL